MNVVLPVVPASVAVVAAVVPVAEAVILVDKQCFADRDDSIMVLMDAGYSRFEVFALLPDARQAAQEHVVAMEMSEP
jgi:hypothetical protein